ncbi:MAG: hypothetical protein L0312_20885, partial [Acidobacteria bacterium]|nr:hypothetical protein [Acidobacteriota bacterium]
MASHGDVVAARGGGRSGRKQAGGNGQCHPEHQSGHWPTRQCCQRVSHHEPSHTGQKGKARPEAR